MENTIYQIMITKSDGRIVHNPLNKQGIRGI